MSAPAPRSGELIHGINVTPLVDVVLVLLIVLMVTASYTVSRALPLELPKASTGESNAKSLLAISVDESGSLYLDGKLLPIEELRQQVRGRASKDTSAVIAADGATEHRAVVGVIDLLRREGVTRFAINVASEDLAP